MRQAYTVLTIDTPARGFTEITSQVDRWIASSGFSTGLLTIFVRHTSASLLIQENADPDVRADLERFFSRLVRDGDALFEHVSEGPDDMPAHLRRSLTNVQMSVPVVEGRMVLGTAPGVYVWDHRRRGHAREVVLHLTGE
jgi:secondary thiamine-phosphate synthase enzyme